MQKTSITRFATAPAPKVHRDLHSRHSASTSSSSGSLAGDLVSCKVSLHDIMLAIPRLPAAAIFPLECLGAVEDLSCGQSSPYHSPSFTSPPSPAPALRCMSRTSSPPPSA